jgi:hypothetical protein
MKLTATTTVTGVSPRRISTRIADHLRAELEREVEATRVSDPTLDTDARRDALARVVRRVWGTSL